MSKNICMYFSDTGGGHRSAAEGIEAAINEIVAKGDSRTTVSIIKDSIAEKSHPMNRKFVEFYNYLLRHHQPLMKYYYWLVNAAKPERGFYLESTARYFRDLLLRDKPAVIVSVHPMISHALANGIKQLELDTKLIVVVTDPGDELWHAWACPGADLTIVATEVVAEKLVDLGLSRERVEVLGMPVHPDFLTPSKVNRRDFLTHLGLSPDTLTVCLNSGWAGGGNILKIYRQLSKLDRPVQTLFLCGHNKSLYEQAMYQAGESSIPTAVLPFHDCMSDLMSAVDIMVTKAGGLTTYQAIAKRLPLVFDAITEPMPQERKTIDMLVEQKLSKVLYTPTDIVDILNNFEPHPNREKLPLTNAYQIDCTDSAVYEIAKKVLAFSAVPSQLSPATDQEVLPCDSLRKFTVNPAAGEI